MTGGLFYAFIGGFSDKTCQNRHKTRKILDIIRQRIYSISLKSYWGGGKEQD
jgi:hypothetical protein